MRGLVVVALALSWSLPAEAAAAYLAGDTCTLSTDLSVATKGKKRKATIAAGSELVVVKPASPGRRFTEVRAGDVSGLVENRALEQVCVISRPTCTVVKPLKLDGAGGKGKNKPFAVQPGGLITVLKSEGGVALVRVGDLDGKAPVDELKGACPDLFGEAAPAAAKEPEPPPGEGVLLVAFALAKDGNVSRGAQYFAKLSSALKRRRGDVKTGGASAGVVAEPRGLKEHLLAAQTEARAANARWLVTGRLAREDKSDVLTVVLFDVASGKPLAGMNVRPAVTDEDPWADKAADLLGEKLPPGPPPVVVARPAPAPETPAPSSPTTPADDEGGGWLVPAVGGATLGVGVLAGATGAVFGTLALLDRQAFDAAPQVSDERGALAASATTHAVVADSLYAGAALLGVVGLGVVAFGLFAPPGDEN